MSIEKVEITTNCRIEVMTYESFPTTVAICYTEHSTDHWCSDSETEADITKDKAVEIITLLKQAFNL